MMRPPVPDYTTLFREALEIARAEEIVKAEQRLAGVWKIDWKALGVIGSVLIGLGGQCYVIGNWVGSVNGRQSSDEQALAALKVSSEATSAALRERLDRIDSDRVVSLQRLAAVEQVTKDIVTGLSAINAKLDRLVEKQHSELVPPP